MLSPEQDKATFEWNLNILTVKSSILNKITTRYILQKCMQNRGNNGLKNVCMNEGMHA